MRTNIYLILFLSTLKLRFNQQFLDYFLTGSSDRTVKIWSSRTFALMSTLTNDCEIVKVVYLKDNSSIATGDSLGRIKIWSLKNRTLLATLNHAAPILDLELLEDAASIASSSGGDFNLHVWSLSNRSITKTFTDNSAANKIRSLSVTYLASGLGSGRVSVWSFSSPNKFQDLQHTNGRPVCVILQLNSTRLLTADSNNIIKLWDTTLTAWTAVTYMTGQQASDLIKINSQYLAFYLKNNFYVYNMNTNVYTNYLNSNTDYDSLALINTNTIALGYARSNYAIEIWTVRENGTFYLTQRMFNHTNSVCSISSLNSYTTNLNDPNLDLVTISTNTTSTTNITSLSNTTNISSTTKRSITSLSSLSNTTSNTSIASTVITSVKPSNNLNLIVNYVDLETTIENESNPTTEYPLDASNSSITYPNNFEILSAMSSFINRTFEFSLAVDVKTVMMLLKSEYDVSDCLSNCSNSGLCQFTQNKFKCVCGPDFGGSESCQNDMRPCSAQPCLNYEKCENILNETIYDSQLGAIRNVYSDFKCFCKASFHGKRCERKLNLCENETCSGNGVCSQLNDTSVKCQCFGTNSFQGEKCEIETTAKSIRKITIKTTYYVAIVVLVALFFMFVSMDVHRFLTMGSQAAKMTVSKAKKASATQTPIKLVYKP